MVDKHHSAQQTFKDNNFGFIAYSYNGPNGLTALVQHLETKARETQVLEGKENISQVYEELLVKVKDKMKNDHV